MIAFNRPAVLVGSSVLVLWILTENHLTAGQAKPQRASEKEAMAPAQSLDSHWQNLAGDDAAKAYRSIWALVSTPRESAAFFKEKLQPVALTDAKQLAQWIAGLDSTRFADRKKATDALEKLGELAEPELRKALAKNPSLEVRQRIEKLLQKLEGPVTSPELLRALRAIEVLEHIGSSDAQVVLDNLARGAPEARTTQDARQSLERLRKRNSGKA